MSANQDIMIEFEEMKVRYENFIRHLPQIKNIKENVFYHIEDDKKSKEKLVNMARGTRPFLAKEIWDLLEEYMAFLKNLPGIEGENYKIIYENFTKADLIKRLIFKRPLVFCGVSDYTVLRFDCHGGIRSGNHTAYDVAKTLNDPLNKMLYLKEYISYDENLLSSLIGMSTPTYYFSIGCGVTKANKKGEKKPHIDEGILCGLVGARLPKAGFIENRFIFPRDEYEKYNFKFDTHKSDDFWIRNVYSDAFPEMIIPSSSEIENKPEIYGSIYIDGKNEVYFEKRLMLSILPFIREAASRGKERNQGVFCGVPPIGGGVWAVGINYLTIHRLIVVGILKYLDAHFNHAEMQYLRALVLPELNLSVYTSFVPKGKIQEITINEDGTATIIFKEPKNHTIKIFNCIRYVAEILPEEFKDCLSIAGYAWDGNSFPGNEYWDGSISSSFDPKAIYCSLLGQFQNPEVNVKLADPDRIRVY